MSGIQSVTKEGSRQLLDTTAEALGGSEVQGDDLLIRLGATTGIVLVGAMALNILSHHMTVNVFWV